VANQHIPSIMDDKVISTLTHPPKENITNLDLFGENPKTGAENARNGHDCC